MPFIQSLRKSRPARRGGIWSTGRRKISKNACFYRSYLYNPQRYLVLTAATAAQNLFLTRQGGIVFASAAVAATANNEVTQPRSVVCNGLLPDCLQSDVVLSHVRPKMKISIRKRSLTVGNQCFVFVVKTRYYSTAHVP